MQLGSRSEAAPLLLRALCWSVFCEPRTVKDGLHSVNVFPDVCTGQRIRIPWRKFRLSSVANVSHLWVGKPPAPRWNWREKGHVLESVVLVDGLSSYEVSPTCTPRSSSGGCCPPRGRGSVLPTPCPCGSALTPVPFL